MKATGEILKEAREKKGISIAEVSLATKINTRVIAAMEDGNMAKLPPKTFLRGFVQSYANFLHLDVDEVMARYQEEVGSAKPEPILTPEKEEPSSEAASSKPRDPIAPNTFSKIGAVGAILLLIALIVLLKNKMDNYQHETIAVPSPAPALPTAAPAKVLPQTTETPKALSSPPPSISPSPTASSSTSSVRTASPAASLTPVQITTKVPSAVAVSPLLSATPSPTPGPSATPVPRARVQDVVIEALDNVSIDAQIDDEAVKKIQLKPDQIENLKAKRKVILKLSDGGAVNIIVNGMDRGVPGDLGKPKKVEIP
jgi:cytoskeleton protein RodZ